MAMDTPAKIAILGAGPMGLEAALYARFLGYDVEIFDRGSVADNVLRWGHVRMFTPFGMNSTSLGLAALRAHDESYSPPAADALLTGQEWSERYLEPLSQTDLLADHLRLHMAVVAVTRRDWLKHEYVGQEEREESPFRLLVTDGARRESDHDADLVIDTTGVFSQPNWMGAGGVPARGERTLRQRIRYDLPDILGTERTRFANQRVLVIGAGYSAATSIVALLELARAEPATRVVWMTRRAGASPGGCPIAEIDDDPLPGRRDLARRANAAAIDSAIVQYRPETVVQSVSWSDAEQCYAVSSGGAEPVSDQFHEIIANVGYRPDRELYSELQVHECYATSGPLKLAARLLASTRHDCLQQSTHGAAALINPEPHFYLLGAKSYGRQSTFLLSHGHQQIRELFALIGEREDLDLYQGAGRLPR